MKPPRTPTNSINRKAPFAMVKGGAAAPKTDEDWFDNSPKMHAPAAEGGDDGESLWLLSYADMMTLLFGFFVMITSFSKIDTDKFEKVRAHTTQLFGGEFKKAQQLLQKDLKDKVKGEGFSDLAFFEDLEKGVAVTFRGSTFFDSGSAEIRPEALDLLGKVMPTIKKQMGRFAIVVEGHTDDSPISSEKFPSNWELSSQRASAVLRVFEANGFSRTQLRAIGYADTVPVLPNRLNDNTILKDNQSQNRRVVIKLLRNDVL